MTGSGRFGSVKNRAVKITYNADGQVTLAEQGTVTDQSETAWHSFAMLQQVTSTYDANARKTRDVTTAGGTTYAVAEYSYDTLGRPDCTAQRMNSATWGTALTACNLGTQESYGPDRISRTEYDAASQVTKIWKGYRTDGSGTAVQTVRTAYTDSGKLASVMDANDNLATYDYDGFDRLYRTHYPNPTGGGSSLSDYEQLGYDSTTGNVNVRYLRKTGYISYTYDALNRLTKSTPPSTDIAVARLVCTGSRPG